MPVPYRGIVLALALAAAGCTSSINPTQMGGSATSDASGCGAADYAPLVGQQVSVLNDAELPENRRVLFPGATVTDDMDSSRLNITIGTDDKISEVYCG